MHRLVILATIACSIVLAGCSGAPPKFGPGLTFLVTDQLGVGTLAPAGDRRSLLKWEDGSYPLDPAVSPDGKRVAFALQPPAKMRPGGDIDFGSDLYLAQIDGKGSRELVRHKAIADFIRTPAWLSDTELIYTYRGRNQIGLPDFRIERLELASGKTSRFIENGVDPAMSRDGKMIVYVAIDPVTQEDTLTVVGADLNGSRAVVKPASKLALFSSPVFSPDGARIAFAAVDLTQQQARGAPSGAGFLAASHPFTEDVWIVNVDGTGLRRLADVAENMPSLTWSGDGKYLYALGPQALWKIDGQSGQAEQIGKGIPIAQIVWLAGE